MPQTLILQDVGSTPASCLAVRSREQSSEPWLFFRRGWKWRWASYGQVADQISRGLRIVRQAATSAPGEMIWGTHGTQHPDSVALGCMLLEAGGALRLLRPRADGSWPTPGDGVDGVRWVHAVVEGAGGVGAERSGDTRNPTKGMEVLEVPAVSGQLDRRPLEALDPSALGAELASRIEDGDGRPRTLAELRARARKLAEVLVEGHRPQEANSWLGRWRARRRLPQRPIVCVSPKISPEDHLVVAWATLALGAAWVLEPQADAFLPTLDWVRPTVVVTDPEDEEEVHRRLVTLPRSQRRLRSVVGGSSDASEALEPQLWRELEIDRRPLP